MSLRDVRLDDFSGSPRKPAEPHWPDALPATSPLATPARPDLVDLRECKAEARRLLPLGHPVRVVLESEPDYLSGSESVGRMAMLMRLILAHRRHPEG